MAITPFKVIQGQQYWYQPKAHMRLPLSDYYYLNLIWYHFEAMVDYCSNLVRKTVTVVFEPLGVLRGNVRCSS